MRELTFAGFLKSYVRKLSEAETNNISKLIEEAAESNPRLREPLFLYALATDKMAVLLRAAKDPTLYLEYKSLADKYEKTELIELLQDPFSPLREEYKKVWGSYLSKKNKVKTDNHSKELMRSRILKLQKVKCVSNYRIYTDLGLNPGNVNAWLKHGAPDKVSLPVARKAVKYLENIAQAC